MANSFSFGEFVIQGANTKVGINPRRQRQEGPKFRSDVLAKVLTDINF